MNSPKVKDAQIHASFGLEFCILTSIQWFSLHMAMMIGIFLFYSKSFLCFFFKKRKFIFENYNCYMCFPKNNITFFFKYLFVES